MTMALEPHLVRIDNPGGRPIGVGCLLDGRVVVTCAHVVATALGDDGLAFGDRPNGAVSLRFPYSTRKTEIFKGEVLGWYRRVDFDALPDDGLADIAFLTLAGTPPDDVQAATITEDKNLAPRDFEAFGYPAGMSMGDGTAGRVTRRLPCDWYRLDKTTETLGRRIEPGFSGGPVLLGGSSIIGGIVVAHDLDRSLGGGLMISGFVLAQAWRLLAADAAAAPFAGTAAGQSAALGQLYDAPGHPANYVERPDLLDQLRRLLLDDRPGGVGLYGMGGIGKSVLAASMLEDPAVRRAFPDGLFWLGAGRDAVPERLQAQLYQRATGQTLRAADLAAGRHALAAALEGKKMLVVVDDVWSEAIVAALPTGAGQPRLLLSTRLADIIEAARAEAVSVETMSAAEAAALLRHHAGEAWPKEGAADPVVAEILRETGGLPLGLALCGTQARESRGRWPDVLHRLRGARLDLVRGRLRDYPTYETVFKSLDASVTALDDSQREHYRDLAIFAADKPIPMKVLEILWGAEDRLEAWEHANLFTRRALASWTVEGDLALHSLQHDYIRATATDLPTRHRRLVAGYWAEYDGAFDQVENDGYVYQHLPRHMQAAEMAEELAELLVDFDWLAAKLAARGSTVGLWRDLAEFGTDPAHHTIGEALRHAGPVLTKRPGQLTQQLCGRLDPASSPIIARLLGASRAKAVLPALLPRSPSLAECSFALLQSLEGHQGGILALALGTDGRSCVSASDDHTLRVWDMGTGRLRHCLYGHLGWVKAVALTADNRYAVSASDDRTLKLWDIEAGRLCASFEGHRGGINAVVLTPDGRSAVSASDDRSVKIWELETGRLRHSLEGHQGGVLALAAAGRQIVSGSADGSVKLWSVETGALIHELDGHERGVLAVAASEDGKRAVSASDDRTLRVWDLETGCALHRLEGHTRRVNAVVVTADGRRAVSASADRGVKIWDLQTGTLRRTLDGHGGRVNALALSPDGRRVISASSDDTLRLWDMASGALLHNFEGHTSWVLAAAIAADGKSCVSAARDRTLKIWDLEAGGRCRSDRHAGRINAVALSRAGNCAVSAADDETLRVWDVATGQTLRPLAGHGAWVSGVVLTPDDRHAVSAGWDGTVKLWALATGNLLHSLDGHAGGINAVAVSGDGTRIVSASADRTLRVWALDTGRYCRSLEGHSGGVRSVSLTPDGRRCISGDDDAVLKVWDLDSGAVLQTLAGHLGRITAISVTGDGRYAFSAGHDPCIRMWELETGRLCRMLEGHGDWIRALALSADGRRLVSASDDGTLIVWDVENGTPRHRLAGHEAEIYAVALTEADTIVVSASRDRTLRLWEIETGLPIAELTGSAEMVALAARGRLVLSGDALGRLHIADLAEAELAWHEG
jgi:WD40 repeat protein